MLVKKFLKALFHGLSSKKGQTPLSTINERNLIEPEPGSLERILGEDYGKTKEETEKRFDMLYPLFPENKGG